MLPNSSGTTANLTSGNTITISEETTFITGNVVAESYNTWNGLSNCRVIVYIQNEDNQIVLQSRVIEITGNTTINQWNDFNLKLSPNPTNGLVQLQFKTMEENVSIKIYSLTGQIVYQKNHNASLGMQSLKIDVRHLESGVYNLSIMQGDKKADHLIMKQ